MTDMLNTEKVYFITVATKPHPVLDILVKNIELKGESIEVLGLTDKHYEIGQDIPGSRRLGLKLQEVYKFINRPYIKNNDIDNINYIMWQLMELSMLKTRLKKY